MRRLLIKALVAGIAAILCVIALTIYASMHEHMRGAADFARRHEWRRSVDVMKTFCQRGLEARSPCCRGRPYNAPRSHARMRSSVAHPSPPWARSLSASCLVSRARLRRS